MHDALHAASRRVTSGWGVRVREERGSRYASKKRLYDRDLNLAPRYDFMTLPQIAECRPRTVFEEHASSPCPDRVHADLRV